MSARVAAYEASVRRLEATLARYERALPRYRRGFACLTASGFACFAFGRYTGLWGAISATFVSVTGYLMVRARLWELRGEIDETLADLERLRATPRASALRSGEGCAPTDPR